MRTRSYVAMIVMAFAPASMLAQAATFRGKVLTDSADRPIPGVVVAIEELKIRATTDSTGAFILPNIKPGAYIVTARKIGFGPLATRVRFAPSQDMDADLLLTPNVTALPDVTVKGKADLRGKLAEFEERRLSGNGGRFLTQADFERHAFATFTESLRELPGIDFTSDPRFPAERYAVAGRMATGACAMCGGGGSGPPPVCMAAVVIDGAMVYGQGGLAEPKFNLNTIDPTTIAGVEYYAGAASIPTKYNGTRSTCGLLVIWTK